MKIQFISNYSQLYGANRVLLTIVEYFNSNGHEILVILPSKGGMSEELEKRKISYHIIPFFSSFLYIKFSFNYLVLPCLFMLNILNLRKIYNISKRFNPDVIYSNTSAENIGIIIARLLKTKHISHIHEFMSLDHGAYFLGGEKLKRKYIDLSNGVIFVSNSVAEHILENKHLESKHIVIHNGIKAPIRKIDIKELPQEINFGIVGILSPGKGQDMAIEYFNNIRQFYPNAKLHLFGDKKGPYRRKLIKKTNKLNIQTNVTFHGFEKNTDRIFEQMDFMLMCSKSEGFGIVTIEAMLRGVPVIGLNKAGTSELITDKTTGCLFDDFDTFKRSIDYLLLSKENYNKIRFNAFEYATKSFSELDYCRNIEEFITKLPN